MTYRISMLGCIIFSYINDMSIYVNKSEKGSIPVIFNPDYTVSSLKANVSIWLPLLIHTKRLYWHHNLKIILINRPISPFHSNYFRIPMSRVSGASWGLKTRETHFLLVLEDRSEKSSCQQGLPLLKVLREDSFHASLAGRCIISISAWTFTWILCVSLHPPPPVESGPSYGSLISYIRTPVIRGPSYSSHFNFRLISEMNSFSNKVTFWGTGGQDYSFFVCLFLEG